MLVIGKLGCMREIILKIAYYYCHIGETIKNKTLWEKIYINGIKLLCSYALELDCRIKKWFSVGFCHLPDDSELPIVSLTSYPARINKVWMVIDSMYHQTVKPQKIILALTKEEFPDEMDLLPKSLKRYLSKGLEIVFTDYNLHPHNKYYYALTHIKDKDVITIDDDLYYWPDTIERLYKIKKNNPGCICANRAFILRNDPRGIRLDDVRNEKGLYVWAQGVGGTLYIPEFRPQRLFDKDKIKQLSLNADDNWLKVHEILSDVCVATNDFYPHPLLLLGTQTNALWHKNVIKGDSSRITKSLLEYYKIVVN